MSVMSDYKAVEMTFVITFRDYDKYFCDDECESVCDESDGAVMSV